MVVVYLLSALQHNQLFLFPSLWEIKFLLDSLFFFSPCLISPESDLAHQSSYSRSHSSAERLVVFEVGSVSVRFSSILKKYFSCISVVFNVLFDDFII